jgi:hypothetical protein
MKEKIPKNLTPVFEGTIFADLPPNYVYVWFRECGKPFYVGVGRNNRYKSLIRRNPHTLNVVRALGGIENVRKTIYYVDSWESGCQLEKLLIAKYGRSDVGTGILTNMTDGGEGTINKIVTEKVRTAVSAANKKRIWSPASKKKTSDAMKGREVSALTREILSAKFKGKSRPSHVLEAMRSGAIDAIAKGEHKWINTENHKNHFKNVVQPKAAKWHSSEEGKKFHSALGKTSWKSREASTVACQFCGRLFETPYPSRAKFCHVNCKQSALRERRGQPVGTRPHNKIGTLPKKWVPKSE